MEKITDIIESIANEKGLEEAEVSEKVKIAFIQTAKKIFGEDFIYESQIDPVSKKIKLFQKVSVVANDFVLKDGLNEQNFITLDKAKKIDPTIEIGDEISYDINLEKIGRTASQILFNELNYHIQRLLEEKILKHYNEKIGELVHGSVTGVDREQTTYVEVDDIKAYLPMKNRIKDEKFEVGDIINAVIRHVFIDKNQGIKIELSRTSPKFLEALLKAEVPEIKDGSVILKACARIPGKRAKIALSAISPNIDPVGATVGTKGVRINAVSAELKKENIDVIEWSNQPEILVARAMSPAIANSVKISEDKAIVYINPAQKSKAIGKSGLNIRLASMLTGLQIELVETGESKKTNEEAMQDLKNLFGDL